MTSLNSANLGQNKYCGPAVLSILTGKSSDECADVIRSINGQYHVTGVDINTMLKALGKLGFNYLKITTAEGASLYRTLTHMSCVDGIYVIWVANHYVVVEVVKGKIYFCDNHTKEPIPAASSARLHQKVVSAYLVIKREEPKPTPKLVNTDYKIGISSNLLFIDKVSYFDDGKGEAVEIGRIKAETREELDYIINLMAIKLKELK